MLRTKTPNPFSLLSLHTLRVCLFFIKKTFWKDLAIHLHASISPSSRLPLQFLSPIGDLSPLPSTSLPPSSLHSATTSAPCQLATRVRRLHQTYAPPSSLPLQFFDLCFCSQLLRFTLHCRFLIFIYNGVVFHFFWFNFNLFLFREFFLIGDLGPPAINLAAITVAPHRHHRRSTPTYQFAASIIPLCSCLHQVCFEIPVVESVLSLKSRFLGGSVCVCVQMAFRGGRGGRGRGGFSFRAKEEKYEVFPEIKELPDINPKLKGQDFLSLVKCSDDLHKFWILSPYHLVDPNLPGKHDESVTRRQPLSEFMLMSSDHFPAELVGKNVRPIKKKKTQWDLQSDLQRLDLFEKLDQRTQGKEEEKKEEEEENENIEEEEDDSDDDYAQGRDYDDDEDENNMNDEHDDDEGCY